MKNYKITHKSYGEGFVQELTEKYVFVKFNDVIRKFAVKNFDKFCLCIDEELKEIIKKANISEELPKTDSKSTEATNISKPKHPKPHSSSLSNALLGPRSQTITIKSEKQMYEIVGYLARPGRVNSIEAEVPKDGRNEMFEDMFPGQKYRPIEMGLTPSGMPNKMSPQFRINFADLVNCPQILRDNIGVGTSSCVGRINKSRFVMELVQIYGFRFGDSQDVEKIRKMAEEKGYLEDFERGFAL